MNNQNSENKESKISKYLKFRRAAASATMIPYLFLAYPLAGIIIGMWLDSRLKTSPWLLLVFLIAGMVEAIREMIRISKRVEEEYGETPKDPEDITDE